MMDQQTYSNCNNPQLFIEIPTFSQSTDLESVIGSDNISQLEAILSQYESFEESENVLPTDFDIDLFIRMFAEDEDGLEDVKDNNLRKTEGFRSSYSQVTDEEGSVDNDQDADWEYELNYDCQLCEHIQKVTQKRKKASDNARSILLDWLLLHKEKPYPSSVQMQELASCTGMSTTQVRTWMSNMRKRRLVPLLTTAEKRRSPRSKSDKEFIGEVVKRQKLVQL